MKLWQTVSRPREALSVGYTHNQIEIKAGVSGQNRKEDVNTWTVLVRIVI